METLEAINQRRSIRKYLERPVEFEKLTTIIDAARKAPSAGNLQDWSFLIVTDKKLIRQVASYSIEQYWIQTAPLVLIVCGFPEKHEMYYGLRGKRLYNVQDCAAAIENLLLAATDLGLGSCWIGAFEEEKIRAIFNIPPEVRPQAIITLGYSDEIPQDKSLIPIESMTFFNRYGIRIEKLHIVFRDYSEEWKKQGNKLTERFKDTSRKIREQYNKIKIKLKKNNKKQ